MLQIIRPVIGFLTRRPKEIPAQLQLGSLKGIRFFIRPLRVPREGAGLRNSVLGKAQEFQVPLTINDLKKVSPWDVCKLLDDKKVVEEVVKTYIPGLLCEFREGQYLLDVQVIISGSSVHITAYLGPRHAAGAARSASLM